jgi:phage terminase large subunit
LTSFAGHDLTTLANLRKTLGPSFNSEEQEAFFDSRAAEILYSGWMGAGKSRILCEKAWDVAVRYPGVTVGMFRKVAASLPATTLRTFQRDVMRIDLLARQNRSESWYELWNGSRIYFLGLDPDPRTGVPSKVGSLDLGFAFVDEAVECTEGDWIMLQGRLRDPRTPWHQLGAATNPGPPTHWLKQRFTPSTEERTLIVARSNRFLPADYVARLAQLPDSAIGRRLGKGEWSAAEGAIWTLPESQVREATGEAKRVVAGLDWGFVHAFAVEVVSQSGSGRLAVRAEMYVKGAGIDQLASPLALMLERENVTDVYADPSEPGLLAELTRGLATHRAGHPGCTLKARLRAATNDVSPGLQAVDKAFRQGMTVDPGCVGLLSEIPGYTWAPDRGTAGFKEEPVKVNDDACDALRYAVMAYEPDPLNPWSMLGPTQGGGVA